MDERFDAVGGPDRPDDKASDDASAPDDAKAPEGASAAEGASGPEPRLVARQAAASSSPEGGGLVGRAESPAASGRVDEEGATFGRHAGTVGSTATGDPVSSVGGAQGAPDGAGVADGPAPAGGLEPERRAGFLEGVGGRRGVGSADGTLFEDPGDRIRSAGEVAGGEDAADGVRQRTPPASPPE